MGHTKKETNLTRRDFVKATAGATAVAGIAASGILINPGESVAAAIPQKWDLEADVVVIGSGFAGLAAAIEAKNSNASVFVMEKMRVAGGNSIINGGVVAATGTAMQIQKGIKDSPELMLKDMMKAGLDLNYPELSLMVAEKSKEVLEWTIDYLGVKYIAVAHLGGHCVPRSHMTWNGSGSAIVSQQLKKLKELGVKVKTSTYMESFVQDHSGRVIGLKIREGFRFPDRNSGKVKYVKAKKGVVLATGGFSNDVAFRLTQDPKLIATVDSTNQPGATADALKEALRIGATPVQPSWIQLGPWASPDEKGFGVGPHFAAGAVFTYGIMVDPKTGKRFVDELANRKVRADAIIKTGNPSIGITDDVAAQGCGGPPKLLEKVLERGVVKKYDTLRELFAAYDIPYKAGQESVDNYNHYLKIGEDKEFGRILQKDAKPIEKAPFYAMRLWPKVHHTMGGVQINKRAEVIGLDQEPIKGLFAAGEAAGGIHGAVRLGSCAVVDCLVFGRIAGKSAATEKSLG